jgi:hypothetical protein
MDQLWALNVRDAGYPERGAPQGQYAVTDNLNGIGWTLGRYDVWVTGAWTDSYAIQLEEENIPEEYLASATAAKPSGYNTRRLPNYPHVALHHNYGEICSLLKSASKGSGVRVNLHIFGDSRWAMMLYSLLTEVHGLYFSGCSHAFLLSLFPENSSSFATTQGTQQSGNVDNVLLSPYTQAQVSGALINVASTMQTGTVTGDLAVRKIWGAELSDAHAKIGRFFTNRAADFSGENITFCAHVRALSGSQSGVCQYIGGQESNSVTVIGTPQIITQTAPFVATGTEVGVCLSSGTTLSSGAVLAGMGGAWRIGDDGIVAMHWAVGGRSVDGFLDDTLVPAENFALHAALDEELDAIPVYILDFTNTELSQEAIEDLLVSARDKVWASRPGARILFCTSYSPWSEQLYNSVSPQRRAKLVVSEEQGIPLVDTWGLMPTWAEAKSNGWCDEAVDPSHYSDAGNRAYACAWANEVDRIG